MKESKIALKPMTEGATCFGSGFAALDIIEGRHGDIATVGGSCGNVMSILAWFGWDAKIVGRLRDDKVGAYICRELHLAGVDTTWLALEEKGESPIVIQKFVENKDGHRTHRYSLTCPDCKGWLPRYRPTTIRHIMPIVDAVTAPMAYYFDRSAPATLKLAQWAREHGAIVVFEPSAIGDEGNFQRAVDLCHILKYAEDRLGNVPDLAETPTPRIIVETAGAAGLRVRWKGRWSKMPAFTAPVLEDAAGSGDWCTAALIHSLAASGSAGLASMRKSDLERALRLGQALAAVNCGYEGARGAMMALSRDQLSDALQKIVSREMPSGVVEMPTFESDGIPRPKASCFSCSGERVSTSSRLSA